MENHPYNLEERTFLFAKNTGVFLRTIYSDLVNREYIIQLVRSSASIGANYIEANECLGEKDKLMRLRISKKETKESAFWLRLLNEIYDYNGECSLLQREALELKLIFSKIIQRIKSGNNPE